MRPAETQILTGDNRETLKTLPANHFHVCATSPPYWALRDYGRGGKWEGGNDPNCDHEKPKTRSPTSCRPGRTFIGQTQYDDECPKCGARRRVDLQLGREKTPAEYVANLVATFREVRRVLRDDGILFVNLGDTYSTNGTRQGDRGNSWGQETPNEHRKAKARPTSDTGCREKELIGVPWQFALAMRADGWMLRQEIIWAKAIAFGDAWAEQQRDAIRAEAKRLGLSDTTAAQLADAIRPQIGACMPQSCEDRCTTSHEHVFMFVKQPRYFADMEAVKESGGDWGGRDRDGQKYFGDGQTGLSPHNGMRDGDFAGKGRNLRTVWTINPEPYGGDHFAAWPTRLVAPMLKMATSERGCCPKCGAPVVRVVEKIEGTRPRPNKFVKRTGEEGTGSFVPNDWAGSTRTKGWRPSCDCPEFDSKDKTVPCRALDPFGGTGTTAGVANALGVDAVLCELFPEYVEQTRKRLREFNWNPPAATAPRRRAKVKNNANQPALFEVQQ